MMKTKNNRGGQAAVTETIEVTFTCCESGKVLFRHKYPRKEWELVKRMCGILGFTMQDWVTNTMRRGLAELKEAA